MTLYSDSLYIKLCNELSVRSQESWLLTRIFPSHPSTSPKASWTVATGECESARSPTYSAARFRETKSAAIALATSTRDSREGTTTRPRRQETLNRPAPHSHRLIVRSSIYRRGQFTVCSDSPATVLRSSDISVNPWVYPCVKRVPTSQGNCLPSTPWGSKWSLRLSKWRKVGDMAFCIKNQKLWGWSRLRESSVALDWIIPCQ